MTGITIKERADLIRDCGGIEEAVTAGRLSQFQDITVSEALVLGLLRQGVCKYIGIFGHGSTDIGEALRVYEDAGLVKTYNVHHETAASHAATALKILTGETAAVITSIGPGALQAFAGSLTAASNGAGVWYIFGDETTHNEGFNMQQIPGEGQGMFLKLFSVMGSAFSIFEPWSIIAALRAGSSATGATAHNGPFFLLAPMNVQPAVLRKFNLLELPEKSERAVCAETREHVFTDAIEAVRTAKNITIKLGNGARGCGKEILELAGLLDAAIVSGPSSQGIVPYSEQRNMTVGGSKGSLSGNWCMNEADLVIVIGARAVCQWDCSGTAWKNARRIINFNIHPGHAAHYNRSIIVVGDAKTNLRAFIRNMKKNGFTPVDGSSPWGIAMKEKKKQWESFKRKRYELAGLHDRVWGKQVMTQPVALKTACDFADKKSYTKLFDAGDVQANGFQIIEDEREGMTFTDTGSSYMGFSSSAVLVSAMTGLKPMAFCGDGSFMMNPQILIDAVEHGAAGIIVIFDNRCMAAINGLQNAQYGHGYKTSDSVVVDYAAMARSVQGVLGLFGGYTASEFTMALEEAAGHPGLAVIHVPVYGGPDERAGMGVFGDWNVGNWCEGVQKEHHRLGL
ncbi:MAG: thiamine pyrophosphate-binding protein [Spirochaetae bacterium HGW-Spirochaetae-1]|jgi:3D-(3,5/4)-trihydroxycyclohexane-1,2-dione acylhydrolase (decyclizing)|nr:MAG: thiamine pyrophosphate-binding protein [Spirochaetae bacterium HGW-Spirochaetae-1]